jgi:hypothetical protein
MYRQKARAIPFKSEHGDPEAHRETLERNLITQAAFSMGVFDGWKPNRRMLRFGLPASPAKWRKFNIIILSKSNTASFLPIGHIGFPQL